MSRPEPIDDLARERASRMRARSDARRALVRRERRMLQARVDVAIGVALALLAVLLSPGLAIVALLALIALCGCLVSWLVQRPRGLRRPSPTHRTHP